MPTNQVKVFDYEPLYRQLEGDGRESWAGSLRTACQKALQFDRHGLLPTWLELLQQIRVPEQPSWHVKDGHVVVKGSGVFFGPDSSDISNDILLKKTPNPLEQSAASHDLLQQFCPWRKGPFKIGDISIDTEWRSDLKWDRIADHVEWRDRRVLDVGCGNGYFGWRMLNAGAHSVVGLDPFLLFVVQHEIVKRLAGEVPNYVLPLTDTCLTARCCGFDGCALSPLESH